MRRLTLAKRLFSSYGSTTAQRLALAGLLLTGSSCSSASQYVKHALHRDGASLAQRDDSSQKIEHALGQDATSKRNAATDLPAKPGSAAALGRVDKQPLVGRGVDPFASAEASEPVSPVIPVAGAEEPLSGRRVAAADGWADSEFDTVNRSRRTSAQGTFAANTSPQNNSPAETDPFAPSSPAGARPPGGAPTFDDPASALQSSIIHHPFEPRVDCPPGSLSPMHCPPFAAAGTPAFAAASCPPCAARPFPGPEFVGDEYVCDGGDKGLPVHYEGNVRAGLDTEDTIAEFVDSNGHRRVLPSTETCLYAPRFGVVRSATASQQEHHIDRAVGHQDAMASTGVSARMTLDEKTHADEPVGMQTRSRASGLAQRSVDDKLQQNVKPVTHAKQFGAYEDFRFLREGTLDLTYASVIQQGVAAAIEWSDGRRPVIVAHDLGGQVIQGRFTAQDYTGVEDRRTPGELTLLKVADKTHAKPGDIVTFTLRFENVGDRELFDVRLVDNLSPRLEYLEGTVDSNRNGQVHVEENGVGGKLVTFEFDDPLPGKTSGYVSFQCRLR